MLPAPPEVAQPLQPDSAITAPAPESYAARRLREVGITSDHNRYYGYDDQNVDQRRRMFQFFTEGDGGKDLRIHYITLGGTLSVYETGTKIKPHAPYYRTRLEVPESYFDNERLEQRERKYKQPFNSKPRAFFTPGIIDKFQAKTPIPTLYFVEGEIKAFAGAIHLGLDIVGLPSNQMLTQQQEKGRVLDESLAELILTCQVETVVLLHDADALTIRWERDKDLSKRPASFAAAVKTFRTVMQPFLDDNDCKLRSVHYLHLDTKLHETAKGLDDLLATHPDHHEEIKADLIKHETANRYFRGINLGAGDMGKIGRYFGISADKDHPQQFYDIYKKYIGEREYIYRRTRWYWTGDELKAVAHQDTEKYMRVGADWMKIIHTPINEDEVEEELVPWKVTEIGRDYKNYPTFLDDCSKFDGFCVIPNFNGSYQRVQTTQLGRFFNLVAPLTYTPKPGPITHSLKFLKHLFQGEGTVTESIDKGLVSREENNIVGDQFSVALDWLTLLVQKPFQKLPVPILVSPENGTGKSTFLNWMRWIFGTNATVLNNEQFKMKFNAHYATKYVIGLDESFQDVEKKAEKERLKEMVTAEMTRIERKGVDLKQVPNHSKIIMCSNDADKLMKLDEGESRWFVVRVPKIPDDSKDPDLKDKLKAEIPALLDYLLHRAVFHEKKDRLWFKPEWFITEQFRRIVANTRNRTDKLVDDFIRELLLTYKLSVIRMPGDYLLKRLNLESKYRIDQQDMKAYLQERRGLHPGKPTRYAAPEGFDPAGTTGEPIIIYHNNIGRCYEFRAADFLTADELAGETDTAAPADGKAEILPPDEKAPF